MQDTISFYVFSIIVAHCIGKQRGDKNRRERAIFSIHHGIYNIY